MDFGFALFVAFMALLGVGGQALSARRRRQALLDELDRIACRFCDATLPSPGADCHRCGFGPDLEQDAEIRRWLVMAQELRQAAHELEHAADLRRRARQASKSSRRSASQDNAADLRERADQAEMHAVDLVRTAMEEPELRLILERGHTGGDLGEAIAEVQGMLVERLQEKTEGRTP